MNLHLASLGIELPAEQVEAVITAHKNAHTSILQVSAIQVSLSLDAAYPGMSGDDFDKVICMVDKNLFQRRMAYHQAVCA